MDWKHEISPIAADLIANNDVIGVEFEFTPGQNPVMWCKFADGYEMPLHLSSLYNGEVEIFPCNHSLVRLSSEVADSMLNRRGSTEEL